MTECCISNEKLNWNCLQSPEKFSERRQWSCFNKSHKWDHILPSIMKKDWILLNWAFVLGFVSCVNSFWFGGILLRSFKLMISGRCLISQFFREFWFVQNNLQLILFEINSLRYYIFICSERETVITQFCTQNVLTLFWQNNCVNNPVIDNNNSKKKIRRMLIDIVEWRQ